VQLGELARHDGRAFGAEHLGGIGQQSRTIRGLEEHQRARFAGQRLEARAPPRLSRRQEALEGEAVGGQPGD
jgi:hypothetical protein